MNGPPFPPIATVRGYRSLDVILPNAAGSRVGNISLPTRQGVSRSFAGPAEFA